MLLCAIILLSNITGPVAAAATDSVQTKGTVSASTAAVFDVSSLDTLAYSHGTVSAWLEYDCGNGIMTGGSIQQWNIEACDRFMTFLREMTGKSEGEKVVINTWFLSHAHTDHFEGFTRFVDQCHDHLDLKSVMYNIDGERLGTSRDITYVLKLLRAYYPGVHYYKPHTGEQFNIAGIEFDVVYAQEDRFYPTSNGQELIIDHLDGNSEYASHGSRNGTYRDECFKETVYSYDTENDTLVATPTTFDYSDFNDTSTVLKATFPAEVIDSAEEKSIILYGDANRVDQTMLKVYAGTDMLKANIMLIPHHGHDAHPALAQVSEADVFLYTQKDSAIYGPNGIADYGVDVGGTYRPALVYNYLAAQEHIEKSKIYWQGTETVCLTFGAAENLPSGMTRDKELDAATGMYGYTCETVAFRYEGWPIVTVASGSNEADGSGIAINTKRIRFDQITSLVNEGRYLIVHDQTDNILMYNSIARASGQTKPNLGTSLEIGSGAEASSGLVDAYYKVVDTAQPEVETKTSMQDCYVPLGTAKDEVLDYILSQIQVTDVNRQACVIPCSGTTGKIAHFWLDADFDTETASEGTVTVKYRNDDATDTVIATIHIDVK